MLPMSKVWTLVEMVCPEGFEPPAYGLEIRCSIRLSYGHIDRLESIMDVINEMAQRNKYYIAPISLPNFLRIKFFPDSNFIPAILFTPVIGIA